MNQANKLLETLTPVELLFIKDEKNISRKELLLYTFLDLLFRNLLELKKEGEVFRVFRSKKSLNYQPKEWEYVFFFFFESVIDDAEMGIELNAYAKYLHEKLYNARKFFLHHLASSTNTHFLTLVNLTQQGFGFRGTWLLVSIAAFFLSLVTSQVFFLGIGLFSLLFVVYKKKKQVILTQEGKSIQKELDSILNKAREEVYNNPKSINNYLTWGANIYLIDTEDKERLAKIINEYTNLPALFHAQKVFKDKHEIAKQNTHSSQTSSFDFVYIQDVFNDAGSSYSGSSGSGIFGGGDFGGAGADGGWGDGGSGCGSGCGGCGGCGG